MARQLGGWADILNLLSIGIEGEIPWHLPDEDLAILGAGSNDAVVEGVPIGVEDCGCVAPEQRYLVWEFSALFEGDDGECASTARFPIDREIFGVDLGDPAGDQRLTPFSRAIDSTPTPTRLGAAYLYQVGIPGISADVDIIVAKLLPGRLAEDMSCGLRQQLMQALANAEIRLG